MNKFKCIKCKMELKDIDAVEKHKKENFDHFEYKKIGSKLRLCFA